MDWRERNMRKAGIDPNMMCTRGYRRWLAEWDDTPYIVKSIFYFCILALSYAVIWGV